MQFTSQTFRQMKREDHPYPTVGISQVGLSHLLTWLVRVSQHISRRLEMMPCVFGTTSGKASTWFCYHEVTSSCEGVGGNIRFFGQNSMVNQASNHTALPKNQSIPPTSMTWWHSSRQWHHLIACTSDFTGRRLKASLEGRISPCQATGQQWARARESKGSSASNGGLGLYLPVRHTAWWVCWDCWGGEVLRSF